MFTIIFLIVIAISVIANLITCFTCVRVASVADKSMELYFAKMIESYDGNQNSNTGGVKNESNNE